MGSVGNQEFVNAKFTARGKVTAVKRLSLLGISPASRTSLAFSALASLREWFASLREQLHPSQRLTEQEVSEIRKRLLELVAHSRGLLNVETASETVENSPIGQHQ